MEELQKMPASLEKIKAAEKSATGRIRLQDFMDDETLEKFNVMRSED
jgi:hypothetical protein